MKQVLVAGATGYLGRHLVRQLKDKNYGVRALARNRNKLDGLDLNTNDIFEAEATKPSGLNGLCENIDIVISSLGITRQKDGLTYEDVDYRGNLNILNEAVKSGVDKFIYISVLGAEKMKDLKIVQAKLRFEETLAKSGMDYTIIRPSGFFSDMLEFLKMAEKGKVSLFGNGENKINPIHGKDLANFCIEALKSNEKIINAGGPEIFSYNEIAELALRTSDKTVNISWYPKWLIKGFLAAIRLFTSSKTYGPLEFMMTVMTIDVVGEQYGSGRLEDFFSEKI